jgi:hypothetical protein
VLEGALNRRYETKNTTILGDPNVTALKIFDSFKSSIHSATCMFQENQRLDAGVAVATGFLNVMHLLDRG